MKVRKWVSNSLEVVAPTPETDRASELPMTVRRNLLSRHLVFTGIVQKMRLLFRLQTYPQSFH